MDNQKKIFRLDLTIAVEAYNEQEAFDTLVSDETINQLKDLIFKSKDNIKEMLVKEDESAVIN